MRAQRAPAAEELDPRAAAQPLGRTDGDDADRAGPRRRACRRRPTGRSRPPRSAAAAPPRAGSLRSGSRAASVGIGEPDRHRRGPPRRSGWLPPRRARSPRATPRAPGRWSRRRRRDGSSRSRTPSSRRTPRTARAARCAAACDRSAGPSRSRPLTASASSARSTTCRIRPSSCIDDVDDRRVAERCRCRTAGRRRSDRRRSDRARTAGRPSGAVDVLQHLRVELGAGRSRVVEPLGHRADAPGAADPRRPPPRSRARAAGSCRSGRTAGRRAADRSSCASGRSRGRAPGRAG